MGKMIINGKECDFTNEANILEVIRKNGFNVPTFCYRPDLKDTFVVRKDGYSLISLIDIAKLTNISERATRVEPSTINGNILIDGKET